MRSQSPLPRAAAHGLSAEPVSVQSAAFLIAKSERGDTPFSENIWIIVSSGDSYEEFGLRECALAGVRAKCPPNSDAQQTLYVS
jgi:hypothetical protein